MTEAMSRREIEDILSSIRKLVSHDPAALAAAVSASSAARSDAPVGKLVLTSALRVADDPAPAEQADETENPKYEGVFARADTAQDAHLAHHAAEIGDDMDAASLLSRITRSASSTAPAQGPTQDPATATAPEPDPITSSNAGNIDAAPQVAPPPLADAQDWLDDADIPLPDASAYDTSLFASADLGNLSSFADENVSDDFAPDASGLEETLARLEAALSGHTAPQQMADAPQSEPTPTAAAPSAPAPEAEADDTAMIDEAMLYQLVANIVRQELQGELGEKITRAIRKLVRSEVARELQLRNM